MTTQQPAALWIAYELEIGTFVPNVLQNEIVLRQNAAAELRRQHARITELESQLAQRFDAAAHGPTSGAADLPEALRVPLDSLHADAGYLCGRLLNGSLTQEQVVESIRRRIDAAKLAALTAQAISAEPAEHVQNPAGIEHVAGDVSKNGAGLNMSTQHARITELESQLAQRFDAADMATAAAHGFRDGVASLSANAGEPRNAIDRDALIDAIAQGLHGTWHCTRVWEAWHAGTMSQDDFEPVDESETPTEIADAVLALLAAPGPADGESK